MKAKIKIQLAREFRKAPTKSEQILWRVLKNRNFSGYKFRRQHVIDGYIIDFYCVELKIAIEIDGPIHLNQVESDRERQKIIELRGIKFIRIKSEEVENNLPIVLTKIKALTLSLTYPLPLLSSAGEGRTGKG
jgi:very-short-patch-repair endonuclease